MSASQEPNSGLFHSWGLGFSTFNAEMDENLLKIGRVGFHLSVLDRDLAEPPSEVADGDRYIVAAAAAGAWEGQEDSVAVYDGAAAEWVFYAPSGFWLAIIEDEEVLSVFKPGSSGGWSTGIAI